MLRILVVKHTPKVTHSLNPHWQVKYFTQLLKHLQESHNVLQMLITMKTLQGNRVSKLHVHIILA
jgi:hypothetical protein